MYKKKVLNSRKDYSDIKFVLPERNFTKAGWLNALIFFGVIGAVMVLAIILPKPKVSEFEGRELAKMPKFSLASYFSGTFTEETDRHFSDTFPFRDKLTELAAIYNSFKGFNTDDVTIHGTAPIVNDDEEPTPPPQTSSTPAAVPDSSSSQATSSEESAAPPPDEQANPQTELDGEMKEGVFVVGDTAMSLFGVNNGEGKRYAEVVTDYANKFGSSVKVYNLVVPTQSEFKLPAKYQHLSASQKKNIDMIYSNLGSNVTPVRSAYTELEAHKNEYLYFRTDHHWTPLGAYYAYTGFCKDAGLTPVPLDKMTKGTKDKFLGSLYRMTQDPKLKANPDYMDYYVPPVTTECYVYKKGARNTALPTTLFADYAKGVNTYSMFMHGDWPQFTIKTNAGTGRTIAVVKESFGNAFVPFLASHYDTVYVIDQRYFEKDFVKFVADNGVNDVLFINNSFAANTTVQINWIKNLKNEKPIVKEVPSSSAADTPALNPDGGIDWDKWFGEE